MRFPTLTVEIVRNQNSRRLCAFVIQQSAAGDQRGSNILKRRNLRKIGSAEQAVRSEFLNAVGDFSFVIKASPDLVRKKKDPGTPEATA